MHLGAPDPACRAAVHLAGMGHLHHEPVDLVLDHPRHPDPLQMQPDRHPIGRHNSSATLTLRRQGSPHQPHVPRIRASRVVHPQASREIGAMSARSPGMTSNRPTPPPAAGTLQERLAAAHQLDGLDTGVASKLQVAGTASPSSTGFPPMGRRLPHLEWSTATAGQRHRHASQCQPSSNDRVSHTRSLPRWSP